MGISIADRRCTHSALHLVVVLLLTHGLSSPLVLVESESIVASVPVHFRNGTSINIVATIDRLNHNNLFSLITQSKIAAQASAASSCLSIRCTDSQHTSIANELTYELVRVAMDRSKSSDMSMVDDVVQRLLSNPNVETLHPNIYLWRNFLADQECDDLIHEHASHKRDTNRETRKWCFFGEQSNSLLKTRNTSGSSEQWIDRQLRTCLLDESSLSSSLSSSLPHSTAVVLPRFASQCVDRVNAKISLSTSLRDSHGYHTQLVEYGPSVGYSSHFDCREGEEEGNNVRAMTSIVYLSSIDAPFGMTRFPNVNISVRAEKGAMLIWSNVRRRRRRRREEKDEEKDGVNGVLQKEEGLCDTYSALHESTAMPSSVQTHKFIMQRWWHRWPLLPADNELDATVCDGGGQCREYLNPAVVSAAHEHVLDGIEASFSNDEVALAHFRKAVEEDPNHIHGWLRLFHKLMDVQELEESRSVLRVVLQKFGAVLNSQNVLKMLRRMDI